jgi:bleomycin hydrolase
MGANQSTAALSVSKEKLLLDRLRALELKGSADNEYVHVSSEKEPVRNSNFKAPWVSLSVPDLGKWEYELLQDPKNRYTLPRSSQRSI